MSDARSRAGWGLLTVLVGLASLFFFFVPAGASPLTVTSDRGTRRTCAEGIQAPSALPDEDVCSTVDDAVSSLAGQSSPHEGSDRPCERDCAPCGAPSAYEDDCPGPPPGGYGQPPPSGSSDGRCQRDECARRSGAACDRPGAPEDGRCRRRTPPAPDCDGTCRQCGGDDRCGSSGGACPDRPPGSDRPCRSAPPPDCHRCSEAAPPDSPRQPPPPQPSPPPEEEKPRPPSAAPPASPQPPASETTPPPSPPPSAPPPSAAEAAGSSSPGLAPTPGGPPVPPRTEAADVTRMRRQVSQLPRTGPQSQPLALLAGLVLIGTGTILMASSRRLRAGV
jgi:LPXTG-motif cell wall-anchored protein